MEEEKKHPTNRRNFLRNTLKAGAILAAATSPLIAAKEQLSEDEGEKIKVLTTDGKVVEVDKSHVNCKTTPCTPAIGKEARLGIPGRKFVMVIDLARCNNKGKCTENCQKGHNLTPDQEWLKVFLMKDNENSEPYWFPRNCFHCDNPPCVKVCPVGATFKRQDNAVLIDSDRCIGCKFCVTACPYSVRIFNWKKPPKATNEHAIHSPESSSPAKVGTVSKCDFCPDLAREGKLPYCITGCPMGALYYGDMNEDVVSNGTETVRFKQLIKDRAGYRYLEELGTKPNVYYLPPVDKMFDYKNGLENVPEEKRKALDPIVSGKNSND